MSLHMSSAAQTIDVHLLFQTKVQAAIEEGFVLYGNHTHVPLPKGTQMCQAMVKYS